MAKRLYRISSDDPDDITNTISVDNNRALLEADCSRLALGEKLMREFMAFCREKSVFVYTGTVLFRPTVHWMLRVTSWVRKFIGSSAAVTCYGLKW